MQTLVQMEFVALGVTAEIVVIVEKENAAAASALRAIEMRGGEPADAGADDDEVVALAGIRGGGSGWPSRSAWAASKEPGWLPRIPVSSGG